MVKVQRYVSVEEFEGRWMGVFIGEGAGGWRRGLGIMGKIGEFGV
jgi:hypothetical protein